MRYSAVVAGCLAVGMAVSWLSFARRIDNTQYDRIVSKYRPDWEPNSAVVAIDEQTLRERHGVPNAREILSEALDKIAAAGPSVVAIDVILSDEVDAGKDARLEASLRDTPRLILPCDLPGSDWEDPLPRFQSTTREPPAHVELMPNPLDGVTRQIPLERAVHSDRRWALSLRALALSRGRPIVESPLDVQVGDILIPARRADPGRPLYIRYLPAGRIPVVSVLDIDQHRDAIRGKAVFLGVTALSYSRDRLTNPYGETVPGVLAHAQAFETLSHAQFLTEAGDGIVLLAAIGLAAAAALIFGLLSGWPAYVLAAGLLGFAHYLPELFYRNNVLLPYFAPVAVGFLSVGGAASYQHFFVRRQLRRSESERSRYQQAIHWAAHEMRTPLTAIQGSSEIMARYNLPEEKRNQLSTMINSESKRLSRIIQTFLDVERLADGQMEMKREPFAAADLVSSCMARVAPLAERKQIEMTLERSADTSMVGDRELMEYALYNLLTNAVKYSPAGTHVRVSSEIHNGDLRLAVADQGIGMDSKEIKNIFQKFYRTKRAEASGEVGTGIGLSIVEQIVAHHGGRIDVTSEPGKGSCFTIVLKAHAEAADRRG